VASFQTRTIAHPHLVAAYEAVLRAIRVPAGAGLVVVSGPTGVGKTTLRLRVQQQLTKDLLPELESEPGRFAVVGVEAVAGDAGEFRWRDFYKRALLAMDEPMIDRKVLPPGLTPVRASTRSVSATSAAPELRHALEQALRHRRPAAFLIDEAQHLKKIASGRRLLDQLDTVKSLASMTGVVHVLLGTYEVLALTNLSGQLNRRTIDVHFPRYRADCAEDVRAFQRVVFSFQHCLPVEVMPDLVGWWERLYEGSVGCVGVLKDWLTRGLAMALEAGDQTLTREHLEAQSLSRTKLLQMAREIKEGEERVADGAQVITELRTMLGMNAGELGTEWSMNTSVPATAAGSPRRRGRRRVGERSPTRDSVATTHRAG
jgi:hypothetical protein